MQEKTIMLICSAGMSTSMLVKRMQKAAEEKGANYNIFAVSLSEYKEKIETEKIDAILLGPQIGYAKDDLLKENYDFPIDVIDMMTYGQFNGEKVLKMAEDMIEEFNK